jgi:hypothetical protein
VRFVPSSPFQNPGAPQGNIVPPNNNLPLTSGMNGPFNGHRIRPARFLIANDPNYPPPQGTQSWEVQGVSPQGRTVILTNVPKAKAVYTFLCLYPSVWDSLFRAALVAFIASEIALPLSTDKKFGLEMRNIQIAIATKKILDARAADGNEGWPISDLRVDWLDARRTGHGFGSYGGEGPGNYWGGLDACCGAGSVVGSAAF